jgi:hypothetical protein
MAASDSSKISYSGAYADPSLLSLLIFLLSSSRFRLVLYSSGACADGFVAPRSIPMAAALAPASPTTPTSPSFASEFRPERSSSLLRASVVFSEPHYVLPTPASVLASETRAITLHATALVWLNTWLDELLFLTLSACCSTTSAGVEERLILPLTTERYKTLGVLRVLPNALGKNAVLEAELAVRELVRGSARDLRHDPALRKAAESPQNTAADLQSVFEELRVWAEEASALGRRWVGDVSDAAAAPPFASSQELESVRTRVNARLSRPSSRALRISPALAVYASTLLTFVGEYAVRALARVVERDPGRGEAGTAELSAAMCEDANLWDVYEGMVRVSVFFNQFFFLDIDPMTVTM